jgi:hypothetical protein
MLEMAPVFTGSAGYRRPTAPGQVLCLPASPESLLEKRIRN